MLTLEKGIFQIYSEFAQTKKSIRFLLYFFLLLINKCSQILSYQKLRVIEV